MRHAGYHKALVYTDQRTRRDFMFLVGDISRRHLLELSRQKQLLVFGKEVTVWRITTNSCD